jgi:hypothetical protein
MIGQLVFVGEDHHVYLGQNSGDTRFSRCMCQPDKHGTN